jgi:hypothetical protein
MVKKHIGMSNAERCRQYRKRLKAKQTAKDEIEKNLEKHLKEANKEQKTEKKFNAVDSMDFEGREPQRDLIDQFEQSEQTHFDFWGRKEGLENPLDKISHQDNLKKIFGNRAE